MTADKPECAKIWQHWSHPEAHNEALQWSLRLRCIATEDLSTLGGPEKSFPDHRKHIAERPDFDCRVHEDLSG